MPPLSNIAKSGEALPIRLLRLGGILACALDAVFTVLLRLRNPRAIANMADSIWGVDYDLWLLISTDLIGFAVITATFWYLSQERHMVAPSTRSVVVLLFQNFGTLLISPGVNYFASAQAGFIFSARTGILWVLGQSAVEVALGRLYPELADWMAPPYLAGSKDGAFWAAVVTTTVVYHLLAYSLGFLGADAVRQSRELARRNAELEATQQIEADAARLAERLTIARELHDELGHHLTALSLNLQLASKQAEGPLKVTVDQSYLIARTVLSDIRGTVTDMRNIQAIRLPQALRTLIEGVASPEIHLTVGDDMASVDPLPSHAIFRSTQEIITNAIRHAGASNLWIEIRREPTVYRVVARDDGKATGEVVPGNGLKGIVERATNLGGKVEFRRGAKGGFVVEIELPAKGTL